MSSTVKDIETSRVSPPEPTNELHSFITEREMIQNFLSDMKTPKMLCAQSKKAIEDVQDCLSDIN